MASIRSLQRFVNISRVGTITENVKLIVQKCLHHLSANGLCGYCHFIDDRHDVFRHTFFECIDNRCINNMGAQYRYADIGSDKVIPRNSDNPTTANLLVP